MTLLSIGNVSDDYSRELNHKLPKLDVFPRPAHLHPSAPCYLAVAIAQYNSHAGAVADVRCPWQALLRGCRIVPSPLLVIARKIRESWKQHRYILRRNY